MKNQYFGDIYDYVKYALIRRLNLGGEIPTALCWMLTPNDGGKDGRKTDYLDDPDTWRPLDPPVFDLLKGALAEDNRDTDIIEQSGLLKNTAFYGETLTSNVRERDRWLGRFLRQTTERQLVVFDPDNGLEVKSVPRGKEQSQHSTKYLYGIEATLSAEMGHSLLVFQFIERGNHREVLRRKIYELNLYTNFGLNNITALKVAGAWFLLAPQSERQVEFGHAIGELKENWSHLIEVVDPYK